jgi:predicted outer membrane repeat protein
VFERNVAQGEGGAIYSGGVGHIYGSTIMGSVFRNNAAANGGACRLTEFDFVAASRLFGNAATGRGGALFLVGVLPDKDLEFFSGNTLARNRAGTDGGAVAVTGLSTAILEKSTFAANEAPDGAHLWSDAPAPWGTLQNCILAFGSEGGAAAGSAGLAAICDDVFGNIGGDWVGPLSGQDGVNGNFSVDPLFCGMDEDDFTLQSGSPCLDPLAAECGFGAVGAHGLGCTAVSVSEMMTATTWGRIKGGYR